MSSSVSHLRDITLAGEFFPFLSVRELRKNQQYHMERLSSVCLPFLHKTIPRGVSTVVTYICNGTIII